MPPHPLEMGLLGGLLLEFVGEDDVVLGEELRGGLAKSVPLLLELLSALLSGGVYAEHYWLVLASVGK